MKKIKNFLPVEFYFLFLPSFFIFLFSFFYLKSLSINAFGIGVFLKDFLGDASVFGIFLPILLLILLAIIVAKITSLIIRKKIDGEANVAINWQHVRSIFFIILLLSFVLYSLLLFTSLLFKIADPIKTAELGNIALSWDRAIFKTDPGIWLINKFSNTFFEKVLLWAYNSIFLILSLVLVASFIFNKNAFRKLILSFFISWIISFPFWFLFPVIPPDFMFRLDKLNMAGLEESKAFNNFTPSSQFKEYLGSLEKIHIINQTPGQRSLPISTFPSMHAAWGVIIVYSGIILWPWLGLILVPWSILNGIGAVYVLEHFSVDIFFGVIIALISIIITEILLRFENKYFEDKFGLLSGFGYVLSLPKKFWNQTGLCAIFKKTTNK